MFMIESLIMSQCVQPVSQTKMTMKWNLCEYNSDCDLPQVCCPGLFVNYCCDIGGHMRRQRMPAWPNVTFPIPLRMPKPVPSPIPLRLPKPVTVPIPLPMPKPVPVPIPIPVK